MKGEKQHTGRRDLCIGNNIMAQPPPHDQETRRIKEEWLQAWKRGGWVAMLLMGMEHQYNANHFFKTRDGVGFGY